MILYKGILKKFVRVLSVVQDGAYINTKNECKTISYNNLSMLSAFDSNLFVNLHKTFKRKTDALC
jgi:hypothetical protein